MMKLTSLGSTRIDIGLHEHIKVSGTVFWERTTLWLRPFKWMKYRLMASYKSIMNINIPIVRIFCLCKARLLSMRAGLKPIHLATNAWYAYQLPPSAILKKSGAADGRSPHPAWITPLDNRWNPRNDFKWIAHRVKLTDIRRFWV